MSGKLVGSVIVALIVGLILGYGVASTMGGTTVYKTTTQTRTVPVTVTTTKTLTSTVTKTVEKKEEYGVKLAYDERVGYYLVDSKGMTLYFFSKDYDGGSNCYGDCAKKWPVFSPNRLIVPSTLNLTDFTFIQRSDGKVQLAYRGQPLYYWFKDAKRGDTTGHGVKGVWFVASLRGS